MYLLLLLSLPPSLYFFLVIFKIIPVIIIITVTTTMFITNLIIIITMTIIIITIIITILTLPSHRLMDAYTFRYIRNTNKQTHKNLISRPDGRKSFCLSGLSLLAIIDAHYNPLQRA